MIILNLISPEQKKLLKTKQLFLLFRNISGLILFSVIILSITLILTNYSLGLSAEFTLNNPLGMKLNENEIKKINSQLKNIVEIQDKHIYWPEIITPLIKLVPPNIELTNFDIDYNTKMVNISGAAMTRNDYLNLITALENNDNIDNLQTPLENLLSKENINFSLNFTYKFN